MRVTADRLDRIAAPSKPRAMCSRKNAARLAHNETVEHDLHRFTDLARLPIPVGTLGGGGPGEAQSPRLHGMFDPQGFSGELRLAYVAAANLWGALVLLREQPRLLPRSATRRPPPPPW